MCASRRDLVREQLLQRAGADDRVVGAALTGSAAAGTEDGWSDVDVFLGVAGAELGEVLQDLSDYLYDEWSVVHHFDLASGAAIYRAFLLDGLLEVDLGLAPIEEFRSHGGAPFTVVFGEPQSPTTASGLDVDHLAGLIWHHVLHARSSIERRRSWQAEHWISAVRDLVLTLAAHRHGKPTVYAKGADALPPSVTTPLEETLVRDLGEPELSRALHNVARVALEEIRTHDRDLAEHLEEPLLELADWTDDHPDR